MTLIRALRSDRSRLDACCSGWPWCRPIPSSPIVVLPALWTHYEHQRGLADLPMVTRTAQGIPGDPINVGLIGDEKEVLCAMNAAGWFPADPVTFRSSIEIAGSVLLDRAYKDAPVSNLFYLGRREDLAFEKPVGNKRRSSPSCPVLESAGQGTREAAGLARRRDLRQERRRQPFYGRHRPPYRCRSRRRAGIAHGRLGRRPEWWTPNIR